jgi:hypothetical protein
MVMKATCIPDPRTLWVRSTTTEAKIQASVDRKLLRPKAEVEWKAATRGEFPTEDVKEQVVFMLFFERGFILPVWLAVLLQAGVGTPCPQLHHCSFDLHSFL